MYVSYWDITKHPLVGLFCIYYFEDIAAIFTIMSLLAHKNVLSFIYSSFSISLSNFSIICIETFHIFYLIYSYTFDTCWYYCKCIINISKIPEDPWYNLTVIVPPRWPLLLLPEPSISFAFFFFLELYVNGIIEYIMYSVMTDFLQSNL